MPVVTRRYDGALWQVLSGIGLPIDPPDPDPQIAARKPLVGAGGGAEDTFFTPLDTRVGPMQSRRSYDGNLPSSFAASAAASDVSAGRVSVWSWKPEPNKDSPSSLINSASARAAFSAFLDTIPTGHKVKIHGQHEPENNMADYGGALGGLEGWGMLQDVIAGIVRSKNRPDDLWFGPCFMGPWTWDSRSPYYTWINQWTQVMDWDGFDFIGIDPYSTIYPGGYSLEQMLTVRNSGSGGGSAVPMLTWLSQFDIPIDISEVGYYQKQPSGHTNAQEPVDPIPPAAVADWIHEMYAWLCSWNQAHPRRVENGRVRGTFFDAVHWYNYTLTGSDCPLDGPLTGPRIQTLKTDAWASVVADSKLPFAGGS